MSKIYPLKLFLSVIVLHLHLFCNTFAQQNDSPQVKEGLLTIRSQGVAFLGSGIAEDDAKVIAINDAKRKALEQAGMYLESHTSVINHMLVKDEIITVSGSILITDILSEARKLIDNMFAVEIKIETTIDLNVLNERITYIHKNKELEEQLRLERERNQILTEQIQYMKTHASSARNDEVKKLVNALTATEWNRLGLLQEDPDNRIQYFTRAIDLDEEYVIPYYNRGTVYSDMSRFNESIRDFNKAIELNPNYGKAYNNRGVVYNNLAKYENAIQDFDMAIHLNPYLLTIYTNRGAAYNQLGENDLALKDFNKAIEVNPRDVLAYNNRAIVFNQLGHYYTAIQDFTKAIELEPEDATTFYNRGSVYLQLKKYEKAIADYTSVIRLNPEDPSAYKNRGIIYSITGNKKNAADDFNAYLKISDNKSDDAKEVRQMIINLGFSPAY